MRVWADGAWRWPQTLTAVFSLREEAIVATDRALRSFERHLDSSQSSVTERMHYFRGVILPKNGSCGPRLLLSAVYDGDTDAFLDLLTSSSGGDLAAVLHEVGFGAAGQEHDCARFIRRHCVRPAAYHIGTLRDTLTDIVAEHRLANALARVMDSHPTLSQMRPKEIREVMRAEVAKDSTLPQHRRNGDSKWIKLMQGADLLKALLTLTAAPLVVACALVFLLESHWFHVLWLTPLLLLGGLALLFLIVRVLELTEKDIERWPDQKHVQNLVAKEDIFAQNQITLVGRVRGSAVRRAIIRFTLWLANSFSRHWYRSGVLAGIDTIHFARFHLFDGARTMLFMSDFDGGWARYLFDFTGVGSLAVVPIWASLEGCPKAFFQRWPSKGFAQRFLPFTRACQIETQCWYSRLRHLTVSEIKRNAAIREWLFSDTEADLQAGWMTKFVGSASNE